LTRIVERTCLAAVPLVENTSTAATAMWLSASEWGLA